MMNLYKHILYEIEHSPAPKRTIEEIQRIVVGTIEDAPIRIGLMYGAAYLGALMDYKNPKRLVLMQAFDTVREAMEIEMEQAHQDFEADWAMWRQHLDGGDGGDGK